MAARRRSHKTRDLPPNLYVRNDGYYSYRDPRTGKEYGLGRDKRYAINQAVEANMAMLPAVEVSLIDRINESETITVELWCDRYIAILERRNTSNSSMAEYRGRVNAVRKAFSGRNITTITTKDISVFLEDYIAKDKPTRAKLIRSTMLDMFREAISEGIITNNPVEATRNARITVKRNRLSVEQFSLILDVAKGMQPWVSLSIELAVLTGQRVSDISKMSWADIRDNRLWVEQKKTGMKLTIPVTTSIPLLGLKLADTIEKCRKAYSMNHTLISSRNGNPLAVETISRGFTKARDDSGIKWDGSPPSFHELRSLSARLYADNKGNKYAQQLLGHKSSQMSERYIDVRGSEWLDVKE